MRVKCPVTPVFGLGIVSQFHHCFFPRMLRKWLSVDHESILSSVHLLEEVWYCTKENQFWWVPYTVLLQSSESQSGLWDPLGVLKNAAELNQIWMKESREHFFYGSQRKWAKMILICSFILPTYFHLTHREDGNKLCLPVKHCIWEFIKVRVNLGKNWGLVGFF